MPEMFVSIPCPEPVAGLSFVYILQSDDGTYYIGQTHDLRERLRKHRLGLGEKHTSDHPGCRLVHWEGPFPLTAAVQREAQLKRWSRAKKEALVRGDLAGLITLSGSRSHHRAKLDPTIPDLTPSDRPKWRGAAEPRKG